MTMVYHVVLISVNENLEKKVSDTYCNTEVGKTGIENKFIYFQCHLLQFKYKETTSRVYEIYHPGLYNAHVVA